MPPLSVLKFKTGEPFLGQGTYGTVYKRTYMGRSFAIKRLEHTRLNNGREWEAMKNLKHENVLELITDKDDDNFKYFIRITSHRQQSFKDCL